MGLPCQIVKLYLAIKIEMSKSVVNIRAITKVSLNFHLKLFDILGVLDLDNIEIVTHYSDKIN